MDARHRQLRPGSRVQPAVDAPHGRRRVVLGGGFPAGGHRGRCRERRVVVDAPSRRGRTGRGGAAAAVRARPDISRQRWRGRDLLRHAGLSAHRPRCRDGPAAAWLRGRRHRRPEAEHGPGHRPRDRGGGAARRPDRRRGHDSRRGRAPAGRQAAVDAQRQGAHPGLRRPHRRPQVDLPHDSRRRRVRQRHLAQRLVALHGQQRGLGADDRRHRARHCLLRDRDAHQRLLRRASARRQPVLGQSRGRRSRNR